MHHAACTKAYIGCDYTPGPDMNTFPDTSGWINHGAGMNAGSQHLARVQSFKGLGKAQSWIFESHPGDAALAGSLLHFIIER